MAIKAPEHAPADLKRKIAVAAQRAKEGKTFAPVRQAVKPPAKFIATSYTVPKPNVSFNFSYDVSKRPVKNRISLFKIMEEVADKYGVSVDDIKSNRRSHVIVNPRLEFYYRARTETLCSYPEIGRFCGGRDHSTVISGAIKYAKNNGKDLPESRQEKAA